MTRIADRMFGLRHLAFFEAAAELRDSDPYWFTVSGVLLTLRFVDHAFDAVEPSGESELTEVRAAISAIGDGDIVKQTLESIFAAVVGLGFPVPRDAGIDPVISGLLSLSRCFITAGSFTVAADVAWTAARIASEAKRMELIPRARLALAYASRLGADFDGAEESYMAARKTGSITEALDATLGLAKIAVHRGNFPLAERSARQVATRARKLGLSAIRARALHDLSAIAGARGDHEGVLRNSRAAYDASNDARDRDSILVNIARALADLGDTDTAETALAIVEHTAQETEVRRAASIQLLELAWKRGDEAEFDARHRALARVDLTPYWSGWLYEAIGAGSQAFGRIGEAEVAYRRMLAIGEAHKLSELTIRADAALGTLHRRGAAPTSVHVRLIKTTRELAATAAFVASLDGKPSPTDRSQSSRARIGRSS